MGVDEARVLKALNRDSADDVTLKDMETLIGLHTALKEGSTTVDAAFPATPRRPLFAPENDAKQE